MLKFFSRSNWYQLQSIRTKLISKKFYDQIDINFKMLKLKYLFTQLVLGACFNIGEMRGIST